MTSNSPISGPAADREVGEAFQRLAPVIGRKHRQRRLGLVGIVGGQVQRGVQGARADDQLAGPAEVGLGLLAATDRALPELGLAGTRTGDGQQQRQGRLALAEVVAGVLLSCFSRV